MFVKIISLPAPRGVFNKCSRTDIPTCGGNTNRTDAEPKHMADGKLEKERGETERLIYGDCVINEHEPESWSWLARQSRSPADKALAFTLRRTAKFMLSVPCRIKHEQKDTTGAWLGLSGDFITGLTVLLESWSSYLLLE